MGTQRMQRWGKEAQQSPYDGAAERWYATGGLITGPGQGATFRLEPEECLYRAPQGEDWPSTAKCVRADHHDDDGQHVGRAQVDREAADRAAQS
jgi:hypothetical protein